MEVCSMRKLSWMLLALAAVPSQAQDVAPNVERWDLGGPRVAIRFSAGVLRDIGMRMSPAGRPVRDGYVAHEFGAEGRLTAQVENGNFQTVDGGELRLLTGPTFAFRGGSATMVGATLRPGREPRTFVVTAADGSPLFDADHQHHTVDRAAQRLRLFNLDLKVSAALAERLGRSALAGQPVGVLEIDLGASGIARKEPPASLGGGCVVWGAPDNDVGLIGMGTVAQMDRDGVAGLVVIAPSATLKNVATNAVPWYSKFSGNFPPYNNDQHPMLVWNMYRVAGGAIRQIGVSGMKHAFLTLNFNCTCNPNDGHILGAGCEDVYSTGNNNFSGDIGPRSELNAHSGVWNRCGSIFDTNCDGSPNGVPGFNGAGDPRRLVVTDADLGVAGASYFFESWYVVRDDVNIFNTMGYRQVTPTFNGAMWSFGFASNLITGPVIDAWVNPANPGPNADSQRLRLEGGQLTLAVRATDVGGGRWRYDYALMNHDFDRRVRLLSVPLPPGVTVTNVVFRDSDRDPLTDWMVSAVPGAAVTWRVGQNATRRTVAALDWGRMNSFSFEVDAAPSAVQGVTVSLGVAQKPADTVQVSILGPSAP
jgi:hypothetical protein